MHAQQAPIQQQSRKPNPAALPCFESSFAEYTSRAAAMYSDEVPLLAARLCAMRDADKFCLPMTVYRNESSYGWAYTNPLAPFLIPLFHQQRDIYGRPQFAKQRMHGGE